MSGSQCQDCFNTDINLCLLPWPRSFKLRIKCSFPSKRRNCTFDWLTLSKKVQQDSLLAKDLGEQGGTVGKAKRRGLVLPKKPWQTQRKRSFLSTFLFLNGRWVREKAGRSILKIREYCLRPVVPPWPTEGTGMYWQTLWVPGRSLAAQTACTSCFQTWCWLMFLFFSGDHFLPFPFK